MDPAAVLNALAEFAPDASPDREGVVDVAGSRSLLWLSDSDSAPRSRRVEELAARDVLHTDERLLRRGWAWVLGSAEVDGRNRAVRLPLLAEPVRLQRAKDAFKVVRAGDLQLTPLIAGRDLATRLENVPFPWLPMTRPMMDRYLGSGPDSGAKGLTFTDTSALTEWLREAAAAAGFPVDEAWWAPPGKQTYRLGGAGWWESEVSWPPRAPTDRLVAVAGVALYAARDAFRGRVADELYQWARRPGLADTALAASYGSDGAIVDNTGDDEQILSPLPLNAAQVEVVRRARRERLAVVSGAPGTGKSHAVVAAALEVVNQGGSVLLATQSTHAADVLGELLGRYPGPTPVLFGDAERREAIAAELADGADAGVDDTTLREDEATVASAAARVRQLSTTVDTALTVERLATEFTLWQPLLPDLRVEVPGAFVPNRDLAAAQSDLAVASAPVAGWRRWWRRRWWRRRRAERRLRAALGAGPGVPVERLRAALEASRCEQAAARQATDGGTDLRVTWLALQEAEAALAAAVGTAMRHRAASARRWHDPARRGAAAVAEALRAGRNQRRELLAGNYDDGLVRALPLWVGTAADVADLLPPVPGLFDLVILDEASHLDQLQAAPVLARGRRALVVGDPRQLRFVSFLADVDVVETVRRHGLDDRVDVRRVSAYDLAAGAAPVTWLDEHYRSVPHLIEFSASRFYRGRLTVATRHPRNDSLDVISVVRVPDATVARGVNPAEVDAVLAVVHQLAAEGVTGIAVISPFRAQANALEAALIKQYPVTELERLGLRAGTVHAFEGSEARVVVVSLALVDADPPARMRFVADPNLFNVMVTRARDRMVVVTSLTDHPRGLIGDYLTFADRPPAPPEGTDPVDAWTAALAGELRRLGHSVRGDYPVGNHTVDLCVGEGEDAYGLVTRVHPDGTAAHRRRQQAVLRAGWRLVDAFPSRWAHDPVRAALEVVSP